MALRSLYLYLKRKKIIVTGKGNKDRFVYISDDAKEALERYLNLRSHPRVRKVFLVEKGTFRGKPISVRGIQKRMEYYAKRAGLKVSCHCLRHTMATQMLNADSVYWKMWKNLHGLLSIHGSNGQSFCILRNGL